MLCRFDFFSARLYEAKSLVKNVPHHYRFFSFNYNHILGSKLLIYVLIYVLNYFSFDLCILLIHLWIEKRYTECRYLEPIECRLFVKTSLFIKCRILHVTRVFARRRRFCQREYV
jgi:hypothetical protein